MKRVSIFLLLVIVALSGFSVSSAQETPSANHDLAWWNHRVFYEVFVRSFYDSSGDGNGDLQGLISKLDYLTDLGIGGLWLMPVMQSPSYHGYDVTDYEQIEQDYGTNDDFRQLIAEAHGRGIAVIVDLPLNHTSSEHPWFIDAQTPGSAHDDWYIWSATDPHYRGPWGEPVWNPLGGRYYYSIFWSGMPDLNYRNPAVTQAMEDISRFWLTDMGVDGFRLDAAKHLIEDGSVQENTPETHAWLHDYNQFVHSVKPDALTVGEVQGSSYLIAPYIQNHELDMAFEFDLASSLISGASGGRKAPIESTQGTAEQLYPPGQYADFLTNHDQNRVLSDLSKNVGAAKVAATMLLTSPGVPFVYYGEEIGMTGQRPPDENVRTPMQWDSTTSTAGFTSGTPWEALASDYPTTNVAAETTDPNSLLNHYRALIHLRQDHPALMIGDFEPVTSDSRSIYSFVRHQDFETLLVVINLSGQSVSDYHLTLPSGPLSGAPQASLIFGTGQPTAPQVNAAGGFDSYTPLPELPEHSSFVISFSPSP